MTLKLTLAYGHPMIAFKIYMGAVVLFELELDALNLKLTRSKHARSLSHQISD